MISLTEFYSRVPSTGFQWIEALGRVPNDQSEKIGRYLIPVSIRQERIEVRNFPPLVTETGLFRRFAKINMTEIAMVQFANEFGLLGSGSARSAATLVVAAPLGGSNFQSVTGESLESWRAEIEDMRNAIALWDAARSGDTSTLSKMIEWAGYSPGEYGRHEVRYHSPAKPDSGFVIAGEDDETGIFSRFEKGDLVQPAMYAAQVIVNRKLRAHEATPKLFWDTRKKRAELKVRLAPSSLISALWLQLAYGIDGDRDYRQCETCRKWFEVAAEAREDAKFCQGSCRSKAYRLRQREAKRLHSAGLTIGKISEKLSSETETVKGWIAK